MSTRGPTAIGDLLSQSDASSPEDAKTAEQIQVPPEPPLMPSAEGMTEAEKIVSQLKAKQAEYLAATPSSEKLVGQGNAATSDSATAPATVSVQRRTKAMNKGAQTQLPYWPEQVRGMPNDMARSALFTVRQKEGRSRYKGHRVATLKNLEIIYTGEELRQRDEDVLLQLLHKGRLSNLGDPITFVAHEMLRDLGWTVNSRSYTELSDSIERMKASSLHLRTREGSLERGYAGSIIRSFEYVSQLEENRRGEARWKVTLEPRIITLFSHVSYTRIDWTQRQGLSPLTKWLHSFYFTHATPFGYKTATLRELCGSTTKDLSKFRSMLKASLLELVKIGFLTRWSIDAKTDVVEVVRSKVTLLAKSSPNGEADGEEQGAETPADNEQMQA